MISLQLPDDLPPNVVAYACVRGAVHGYEFVGEAIELADGRVQKRAWNDFGARGAFANATASTPLSADIRELAKAPAMDRPGRREATISARAGSDVVEVSYARPLVGDGRLEHPADRIYALIFGWP